MGISRTALFLVAGAAVVQLAYIYPLLPERTASHFDGSGAPDGFQSRDGFVVVMLVMVGGTAAMCVGLRPFFRRLPSKWFNLPHRDYWLAPERREESLDFISTQLEWHGAATLLLLVLVIQLVVEANLSPETKLDSGAIYTVLAAYLGFNAVWLTRFVRRFRKPAPPLEHSNQAGR